MKKTAIILAGGSGTRAGGALPKQLQMLGGEPVFVHSIRAFLEADPDTHIVLVINERHRDAFLAALEGAGLKAEVTGGGDSRPASVIRGLALAPGEGLVAVHDAARPLVTPALIRRAWEDGGVPVVPLTDSIRRLTPSGSVSVPRREYVAVQTPQVFPAAQLKRLYAALTEAGKQTVTDDASLLDMAGLPVRTFEGDARNFKITHPSDLRLAELLISDKS